MKRRPEDLVVFLGPSLPADEARRLAHCRVLPPARQGDVWRALALRPRAIALVDGVFEAQPSVWHHELLAALEAGVAVFGGASMGALRAAELAAHGMVGVGQHLRRGTGTGVLVDDSEVALLHADAEHGYRPLTVPLVNVRHVAAQARAARVLNQRQARGAGGGGRGALLPGAHLAPDAGLHAPCAGPRPRAEAGRGGSPGEWRTSSAWTPSPASGPRRRSSSSARAGSRRARDTALPLLVARAAPAADG